MSIPNYSSQYALFDKLMNDEVLPQMTIVDGNEFNTVVKLCEIMNI